MRRIDQSNENWFNVLEAVPRYQLGQAVPQTGRQFAGIAQTFLHEYGHITMGPIRIVAPENENGPPMVEVWHNHQRSLVMLADLPIPGNINNFVAIQLSYFDIPIIDFLRQFQQNALLENVNLAISISPRLQDRDLLRILDNILPLIRSLNSIQFQYWEMDDLRQLFDVTNNNEFSQMINNLMAMPRILETSYNSDGLHPTAFDWCCRWLYNYNPHGKPRVLYLSNRNSSNAGSMFIDRIRQDFLVAQYPVSFFIIIVVDGTFKGQDFGMNNFGTNETLTIKYAPNYETIRDDKAVMISRYSQEATKQWILANENEVIEWDFDEQDRTIHLLKHMAIRNGIL